MGRPRRFKQLKGPSKGGKEAKNAGAMPLPKSPGEKWTIHAKGRICLLIQRQRRKCSQAELLWSVKRLLRRGAKKEQKHHETRQKDLVHSLIPPQKDHPKTLYQNCSTKSISDVNDLAAPTGGNPSQRDLAGASYQRMCPARYEGGVVGAAGFGLLRW